MNVAWITSKAPLAAILFSLTYLALAMGRVPRLRLDRSAIALVGAAGMIGFGVLDLREAAAAVNVETLVLLFGMMILAGYLRLAGFFALVTERVAASRPGPLAMLAIVIGLSGGLSAFLVNDVVCVAMTPLVLGLCRRMRRPSIPYLVGLATASNVGSVATITGNPQNIIIGSLSGISYARFACRLAPIAVAGLLINFLLVALVYRRSLMRREGLEAFDPAPERFRVHRKLLTRAGLIALATIPLFFAGLPTASVALVAAAVLMLDCLRPERAIQAVDWPLLVMFAGLFVVVHAFDANVVHRWDLSRLGRFGEAPVVPVSILSVALSNLVSNVPAVLLFQPLMPAMADQEQAWLALAMSSTLAGNLTILGSVANLIVVEGARREGTNLGFVEYLKVGVPLTLLTTILGAAWLSLTRY